jgi:quercetin dioxygenase-like cupin family protein
MKTAEISVPFEVIQLILELAPGAQTPLHSHGGPDLITLLAGEVTVHLDATGVETVYNAGEFWTETPGVIHMVSNTGQETARMSVVFLLPEGATLTTVKEGASSGDMPPGPTVVYRTSMAVTTVGE